MPCASPPPAVASSPSPSLAPSRTKIDAALQYESQFADIIFGATVRYDLAQSLPLRPFARVVVGYDTRSAVPGLGQIYNEDAVIPAFGFRAPLGEQAYGEIFVQGGYSFGLRGQYSFPETRWGFDYSRDYGTSFLSAYPHAEVNAALVDYSRFAGNVIGFNNAFYDARLTGSLRAVVGATLSFDDHRDYPNNFVEANAGFLVPLSSELNLILSGVEGAFFSRGVNVPNPRSYKGFRVTLQHSSGQ
jgi:hypothetical protein